MKSKEGTLQINRDKSFPTNNRIIKVEKEDEQLHGLYGAVKIKRLKN